MITQQSNQLQRNYKNKAIFTLISITYIFVAIIYSIYETKPEYITGLQNFLLCRNGRPIGGNRENLLQDELILHESGMRREPEISRNKKNEKLDLIQIIGIFTSIISVLFSIITVILVLSSVNNKSIIYIGFLTYCFVMANEAIIISQIVKQIDIHKAFYFINMIIFLLITTFIINSIFKKPRLFSFLYLTCYICIYFFKLIQLKNDDDGDTFMESIKKYMENFIQKPEEEEEISFFEKYEKIIDICQIVVLIILMILSIIFFKSFGFYNRESKQQDQLMSASISVTFNKFFFFKHNFQESVKNLNFENTKYLLSINNINQVILYTENLKNGIIVGVYENNMIKFNESNYVGINVKTDLTDNISYVESPIIVFNDLNQSIAGPHLSNAVTIQFNRTNDIMFEYNYLLPTGEYILNKSLSTLAFSSCVNKITAFHHLFSGCLLYYPDTQLVIGNISSNLKKSLMVDKVLNGKRIFKIENDNLFYLSPITKDYVMIDAVTTLVNNGFTLVNSGF